MAITCPRCQASWIPGSKSAAASLFCPSCRHQPALGRIAAAPPAAKPAEAGAAKGGGLSFATCGRAKDVAIVTASMWLVLTLTLAAFGSAWVLRARPAAAEPNLVISNATASVGSATLPKRMATVERIGLPREVLAVMPAMVETSPEEKTAISAPTESAGLPLLAQPNPNACPAPADSAQKSHGTTVEFADSPADALKQAAKEHKLVFVLHISGNFEESGFT
ncbi:MAG TPA: hypothetical protein VGZ47_10405 [Gemmataceae bacterium]|jgi:hypothetical protein|nr:hypothetical protein [Gemmataceae bacterium]